MKIHARQASKPEQHSVFVGFDCSALYELHSGQLGGRKRFYHMIFVSLYTYKLCCGTYTYKWRKSTYARYGPYKISSISATVNGTLWF